MSQLVNTAYNYFWWSLGYEVQWDSEAEVPSSIEGEIEPEIPKIKKESQDIKIIDDYSSSSSNTPVVNHEIPVQSDRKTLNRFDRAKAPAKNPPSNVRELLKKESVSLLEVSRSKRNEEDEQPPIPSSSSTSPSPRSQPTSNGVGRGFGIAFDPSQVKLRSAKRDT